MSCVVTVPPLRERRSDARRALLRLGTIDDARRSLRVLHGRAGPGRETLHLGLTRLPVVHPNLLWRWVYEMQERESGFFSFESTMVRFWYRESGIGEKREEEAYIEVEWAGPGFGTGGQEQDTRGAGHYTASGLRIAFYSSYFTSNVLRDTSKIPSLRLDFALRNQVIRRVIHLGCAVFGDRSHQSSTGSRHSSPSDEATQRLTGLRDILILSDVRNGNA